MNGLVNLYKPPRMSSASAVSRVKRILGEKTVGHMGTLDPMAEGVLVIGVGKSARLFDYFLGHRKRYIAKFEFGKETDTLDAFGTVIATTDDVPSDEAALHAIRSLIGKCEQIPPAYSAKHVDGKRAYALARGGATVSLKPVEIEIYDAELVCQPSPKELVFSIDCSAGTYIRSICRDVAKMCGSLATLTYLQRTRSGQFDVRDSVTLENLEITKGAALIPPDRALSLPRYDVDGSLLNDLDNGRKIECDVDTDSFVYCCGTLYGIGKSQGGALKIKTFLKDG